MASEALSAWAARGLREVLLPSGTEVRIRIPEADLLIRKGLLPDDLLAVASRFVTTGVDLDRSTDEDRLRFNELVRHLVANMVRGIRDEAGGWVDITVTADQMDELELPPDDIRLLELIARRQATPEIGSAASRAMQAGRSMAEALGLEEAEGTVDSFAGFRGEPAGVESGADGGAVRAVAGHDVPGPV